MAKKEEMLEAKRALRVGFDFALGMMRAAAEGTTAFVERHKDKENFPESASLSIRTFFSAAAVGANQTIEKIEDERKEQADEEAVRDLAKARPASKALLASEGNGKTAPQKRT